MGKAGFQLYTLRESAAKDLLGTIKKVAEMGYRGIEFAGFFKVSAEDVKRTLIETGISPAGAHVQLTDLRHHLEETLAYHETIGNQLLICPFLPEDMRTTRDDFEKTAELLNEIGKKVKQAGFEFGYHNHAFEFASFQGETGFDILYENTDPDYMKMELDCYWAEYAGYDTLEIIDRYGDRCVSIHMKDMKKNGDETVSTELGLGSLDLDSFVKKGQEHQVEWFIVEQEHFTQKPIDSARLNAEKIKNIMNRVEKIRNVKGEN
ncbi:sugar phosphate isomerase/epimerase family protein [Oceanobacillus bengalensis]|uniref:Sugar phosphate isomerase/epimerase n=1 Tax=Oceanobacillus bengalensis TaxID=1435466 RepID=A0A494Z7I4_9BACI|nr:sugar phosphate isomerase/epimerase [Oceanobacillus bengalensis]RKQ18561.1 sugar phosphate isomerase/epimerase [Oceanobacillus bengalensis]